MACPAFYLARTAVLTRLGVQVPCTPHKGKGARYTGFYSLWMGLAPTDTPLLLRDVGSDNIYSLTLEALATKSSLNTTRIGVSFYEARLRRATGAGEASSATFSAHQSLISD